MHSLKIITSLFIARTKEYYRDKGSFGWNILFPFFIVFGFYFIFNTDEQDFFKVGLVGESTKIENEFFQLNYIKWINGLSLEEGQARVGKHKIDFLIDTTGEKPHYFLNSTSKNGYLLEKMLLSMSPGMEWSKESLSQKEISYIDWVIPGILAMNIMFNCLWGIGYVIVRYRQNSYLKRLKATPIKAYQYLLAQILSRYLIAVAVTLIVFVGAKFTVGFSVKGSYFSLFIAYTLGIICVMSVGLIISARTSSKELADGLLNVFSWPMMILSGVWFSIEDSSEWVRGLAQLFPLTHLVDATRAIMTEGASLLDVSYNLIVMAVISVVLITLSSFIFKWDSES